VGFAAEADGAAAEAKGSRQRHVRGGGLAERFERLKAEADDVGGEAEFILTSQKNFESVMLGTGITVSEIGVLSETIVHAAEFSSLIENLS
jgi:hypothetical protein